MHFEIFNCFDKSRTFFSEIHTASAGTITIIDINTYSVTEHEYVNDHAYSQNEKITVEEIALLLDKKLQKNYTFFKKN